MSDLLFSVLIPAAGASTRLGQAKQLVHYKSGPLIQNAVNRADSIGPLEIIVITGANAKAVTEAVHQSPVRWIHNPDWSAGMGSSIAAGAAGINPVSSGVMILLCDQWRLQTSDLQALAKAWRSAPERIAIAEAGGRYMPPVIFPSTFFKRLQQLKGDQGARSLIKAHADLITAVAMQNAAVDLDNQDHFNHLKNTGL